MIEARLHSANVTDWEGIKLLLDSAARDRLPQRLTHLWLDAGYTDRDRGAGWVGRALGWTAEIVRHPPKPAPEEAIMRWARKSMPQKGPRTFLPKRWIVERTFS